MKAIRFLSLFLALGVFFPALADDLKIGFVNIQRVVRDAPAAISAAGKLNQEFSRRDKELQEIAKDIQARQDELRSKAVFSELVRAQKEKAVADLIREFQRRKDLFLEDLSVRQNEENSALIERANNAIKQIATDEKFDVIVQDAVAVADRVDITDKVIKALSDDVR